MKRFICVVMAALMLFLHIDVLEAASVRPSVVSQNVKTSASGKATAGKVTAGKTPAGKTKAGTPAPVTGAVSSGGPRLSAVRYGDSTERLRIVLDTGSVPEYTVTKENNGTRLVVTMNNLATSIQSAPDCGSNVIRDVILGTYGSDTVQLIVDMKAALDTKVYALQNPGRIVIDIQKEYEKETVTSVAPGLSYTKYVRVDSRGMLTSYLLEVDRNRFDVGLALAGGSISSGRASVKSIAGARGAVAAVNGGYFGLDGMLIGNTRIDGQTAGTTYYRRTSLGFMPDGTLKLAPSEYYGEVNVKGKKVFLSGVNCERGENTTILYNSLFGSYTKTNEFGTEYVIRDGRVTAVSQGNSFIPSGSQVISVHGTAQEAFAGVKVGDKVAVGESFGSELDGAKNIIGAGPELLRGGMVNVTAEAEQFPNDIARGRAPRTAVGIKADGKMLLLVVDGRQSHSIGATLVETAQLLKRFGAVNGFNLDGGGSSELVLQGQIMNSPSDGRERAVGSAVVVVRK